MSLKSADFHGLFTLKEIAAEPTILGQCGWNPRCATCTIAMENALTPLPPSATTVAPAGSAIDTPRGPVSGLVNLPARTLWMLAGSAMLLAVVVVLMLTWGREPAYRVLFANVSDKDGGAILAQLAQMNIPYRHAEGGAAILVPADKVHDVRLKLASQGLPKGSVVGLELMDQSRFGQTQFQERLTFQRGLEGELTRSIMSLGSVQSARVHLALPQQNGFFREQQKPSASVLLTLHPGRSLDRVQIAGIVHLVSSSVPELSPKAVSVVDHTGALLAGQGESDQGRGLDAQQLQYVQQIENSYLRRMMDILEPMVGKGNVRATVAAEVDFTQSESTSEQFRPNQGESPSTVRSVQTSEIGMGASASAPSGVPGAVSNQPPTVGGPSPPAANAAGASPNASTAPTPTTPPRREQVMNFEVDKTIRVTRNATGVVRRVNAAVVLNHRSGTDAKGRPMSQPLAPEELDMITAVVQESIGFNKDRGDSVKVINAPFQEVPVPEVPPTPWWRQQDLTDLLRSVAVPAALALVAVALILGVVRPALKSVGAGRGSGLADLQPLNNPGGGQRGSQLNTEVGDPLAIPLADGHNPGSVDVQALPSVTTPEGRLASSQLEQARVMARENPVAMATIVRGWMQGQSA